MEQTPYEWIQIFLDITLSLLITDNVFSVKVGYSSHNCLDVSQSPFGVWYECRDAAILRLNRP